MGNLEVSISTNDSLSIRQFSVREGMSSLFFISLVAVSRNQSIDFDAVVGRPARFTIRAAPAPNGKGNAEQKPLAEPRLWQGLCSQIHEVEAEETGLATYHLTIVHPLWMLTQRTNYRIFQQLSEPAIVLKMLEEWRIKPDLRLRLEDYKKRKYRVQYAETDFDFMSRMLEDAGIAYYFRQDGEETRLVLSDRPQSNEPRKSSLAFADNPSLGGLQKEYVTAVNVTQRVRPGKFTIRDHDYRKQPEYKLMASASGGLDAEQMLERFHYMPGAFLFGAEKGDETPVADDKGKTRTDEREGAALAQKRLEAKRAAAKRFGFDTNALDLSPGAVLTIVNHPRADLGEAKKLLLLSAALDGTEHGEWVMSCEAMSADIPYRPPLTTKRPTISGVESATVVGPKGEEIHTDEFGRVRVHFHWDRESQRDDGSSCWIHVSQPWAGSGYGGTNLPRVGQEVLVDFIGGDPDRPIITGRVFTNLQKTPYKLPENKTQSGWKSSSTGGTGGFNEIMFEDKGGQEVMRMQAERDKSVLVKRNCATNVGSHQTVGVGGNRTIVVGGAQSLTAKNDVSITSESAGVSVAAPGAVVLESSKDSAAIVAKVGVAIGGEQLIQLTCGSSTIIMTPSAIVIESPQVAINPGASVTQFVLENGSLPREPVPPSEPELPRGPETPGAILVPTEGRSMEQIKREQERRYDEWNEKKKKNAQLWADYRRQKADYEKIVDAP